MKHALVAVAVLVACSHGEGTAPPATAPAQSEPLKFSLTPRLAALAIPAFDASDIVLAIADGWTSTKVTISHFRRAEGALGWERVGNSWDGVIGYAGLAWGIDPPSGHGGPIKREGDGASPAGAFWITHTFGFVERAPDPDRHRYIRLDDQTECVDDPKSAAYNQIVEHTGSADWTSSEHMRTVEGYELGAVVDHNPARTPGAGSCIFLHIWDGPNTTTVGCTAMDKQKLTSLLEHLGERPIFVLLPRAEYQALQAEWGLPSQ